MRLDGTFEGKVTLTLVDGGLSPEALVANPMPTDFSSLQDSADYLESQADSYEVPLWEAKTYVARIEEAIGRPLDCHEIDRMLQLAWATAYRAEQLRKMLAGQMVLLPMDQFGDDYLRLGGESEDDTPEWRVEAIERFNAKHFRKAG